MFPMYEDTETKAKESLLRPSESKSEVYYLYSTVGLRETASLAKQSALALPLHQSMLTTSARAWTLDTWLFTFVHGTLPGALHVEPKSGMGFLQKQLRESRPG